MCVAGTSSLLGNLSGDFFSGLSLWRLCGLRTLSFLNSADFVVAGKFGERLVQLMILLELIGANMITLLFLWRNVIFLLPQVDSHIVVLICIGVALPTIWLLNFSQLSGISLLGFLASLLVTMVAIGVFVADRAEGHPETANTLFDVTGVPITLGIFLVSMAGHTALPHIYEGMKQPKKFDFMLNYSFIIIFAVYVAFATFGYLVYGSNTDILVTKNMIEDWPKGWTPVVATIFVALNAYTSVSPMITILGDLLEKMVGMRNPMKKRMLRTVLYGLMCLCSWVAMSHLAYVEAITGALCTMATSFVFPSWFYLKLYGGKLSCFPRMLTYLILIVGVVAGVIMTVKSLSEL